MFGPSVGFVFVAIGERTAISIVGASLLSKHCFLLMHNKTCCLQVFLDSFNQIQSTHISFICYHSHSIAINTITSLSRFPFTHNVTAVSFLHQTNANPELMASISASPKPTARTRSNLQSSRASVTRGAALHDVFVAAADAVEVVAVVVLVVVVRFPWRNLIKGT
jgi:hypothetical protein